MNQFKKIFRRGTMAFALLFTLGSLHPLALTGFAQKNQPPVSRATQGETERQIKADYQQAHPIPQLKAVEGVANGSLVTTNAVGNTTYSITFDAGDAIGGLPAGTTRPFQTSTPRRPVPPSPRMRFQVPVDRPGTGRPTPTGPWWTAPAGMRAVLEPRCW